MQHMIIRGNTGFPFYTKIYLKVFIAVVGVGVVVTAADDLAC